MDPVSALRQIAYYKDRAREDPRRVMAYRNAADVVAVLTDAQREQHGAAGTWQQLPRVGPKTATVIAQAWSGREPDTLVELRTAAKDLGGGTVRAALRGDLHLHSDWSDGSAPIEEMMATAQALGHEYCALTDHSPRLRIANGLSADRLRRQLDVIDELRERFAPMRILTGIEVDILDDGSLDQEADLLDRLDIVVASVHSKLRMPSEAMTRRGKGVHRLPRARHRGRDQRQAGAPRPPVGPAPAGAADRLPVLDRHRRPCPRATRLPGLRRAAGSGQRGARRPDHQHLAGAAAAGLGVVAVRSGV